MGIRIKDAELVKKVTGKEKIPVSDGSNMPKTVSAGQLKEFANEGMATETYVDEQVKKIPVPDVSGQIAAALADYVKKVEGKGLSTNDFTDELKQRLESITPFDPSELEAEIGKLETALNTLVGGNASNAIESFNEIIAFLENVSDKDTLEGILAGVTASIPTKVSQLDNDKKFVTTEEIDSKLEALTGNDLLALEISEVGEVSVTYGEKSDFVGGQIRETGELVLEFNIE